MKHRLLVLLILVGIALPLITPQPVMAYEEAVFYAYKDTYISRTSPDTSYYDSTTLWISGYRESGEVTYENKAILEFHIDWGVDIPSDAGIISAVVRLYYRGKLLDPSNETLEAYRMLRTDWLSTSCTWNEYRWDTDWTAAGGWGEDTDYINSYDFVGVPSSYGWVEIYITGQVEWAQTNDEVVLVILGSDSEWSGDCQFYSKDYTGTTYDPQLEIHYIPVTEPPDVTTLPATSVAETAATLRGYLDDDGNDDCSIRFQYGTTAAYGTDTAWDSGYGWGDSLSERVYGLTEGTVYHYRVQAVNGEGTVVSGDDETFATLPYSPSSFTATAGDEEVALAWSKGAGADKTMIRRSTVSYPGYPTSGTQVYFDTGTSDTDGSLTNDTTYYYSAWSFANDVYSSSAVYDVSTPSAPAAPDVTTNAATNVEATAARVNMHLDSLNGAASADLSFEYYAEGEAVWGESTGTTEFTDPGYHYVDLAGLDAATLYYFRAKAVSGEGTGYGDSETFTTGGAAAPTMTTEVATGVLRESGTINGKVADDGDDPPVTVWFEWGLTESLSYETETISGLITDDTFYYGLTGLDANTKYYYRAIGQNSEGIGYGVIDDFTTATAAVPTVRTDGATPGANQARLYGTVLTDGDTECEVRFQWGTTDAYGTDTAWLDSYEAGQSFEQLITGLELTTTYHYRAQAKNEGGTVSGSDATFTTVFTAPTDFRAKAISHTTVNLDWTLTGDMTLIRYQTGSYPVDKESGTQCYFGTGTTASVSSLESGTTYYFRAWSWREGNVWATNYTDDVATTYSASTEEDGPPVVTTPDTPGNWFQTPTGERLADMPLYTQFVALADSLQIPEGTWWLGISIFIIVGIGALTWRFTRKAAIAIIASGFAVLACSVVGMIPLWFLFVYIALGGGLTYVSQRM